MTTPVDYVCKNCDTSNILVDAWAVWDTGKQEYVLHSVFDHSFCEKCEGDCSVNEVEVILKK